MREESRLFGASGALCLSIDDVHPGRSVDHYEAGGDLDAGVLGRLAGLLRRHPQLRATLFVTPNWREHNPRPTRLRLARVPWLRDLAYLSAPLPRDSMRLDRHPPFVSYLKRQSGFEIAVHGLTHVRRGRSPITEFERLGTHRAVARLERAREIFARAHLPHAPGFSPPGWEVSSPVLHAISKVGFRWISSGRDITSPIERDAKTAGTGLRGLALIRPERVPGTPLIHIPVNFQHTSSDARAFEILDQGGLVSIKAHAVKDACGHIALDGLDQQYCDRLDRLFCALEERYGQSLWWATMGEIADRMLVDADAIVSA